MNVAHFKVVIFASLSAVCLGGIAAPRTARAAEAPAAEAKSDDNKGDADGESSREESLDERSRRLGDRIKSVQRKVFLKRLRHELSVNAGASINDAFYQQFTLGAGYNFHITEHFSIEANFRYHLPPLRTDAVRVVRATEVATPIQIFSPILNVSGEVQFAPIYGKMSLMAEKIIHYDVYLGAGFGAMMTDNDVTPWHAMGTVAIGARIMTTDWLTVRVELRDLIYQDTRSRVAESAIQNLLLFNLGVSFFLPPTFDYRYE